jgi:hypothetical protein
MRPAIEIRIRVPHQTQPGLMHKRGGLQRLVGRFVRHFHRCKFTQFAIHQRQQFFGGLGVAVLNGLKDARDVTQSSD